MASRIYRQYAETWDAGLYPPPGEMVDIGGRRQHLCQGGEGTPSVVIVPCMGGPGVLWRDVQRKLVQYTGVYTYDRAGLGWSDPGPWPRSFPAMADELHQLLIAAAIPPPYVVIGHSIGGIIARQYAVRYPEGLAGLVLVDSSHEDQNYRLAPFLDYRLYYLRQVLWTLLQPLGLLRLAQDLGLRKVPADLATPVSQAAKCARADVQEIIE
ncbi:MAG: alpha/beta fold hydrolase, partial [Pseudonocardiales bacterium]|nr:alpha/beta fold hydrolase [Pseudonocardiales bacterium]